MPTGTQVQQSGNYTIYRVYSDSGQLQSVRTEKTSSSPSSTTGVKAVDAAISGGSSISPQSAVGTSTATIGGKTYEIRQEGGQYIARPEGSNIWGNAASSAQGAATSAAKVNTEIATASRQAAAESKPGPYYETPQGRAYEVIADSQPVLSVQGRQLSPVESAAVRYAGEVRAGERLSKVSEQNMTPFPEFAERNYSPPGAVVPQAGGYAAESTLPGTIGFLPNTPAGLKEANTLMEREATGLWLEGIGLGIAANKGSKPYSEAVALNLGFTNEWGDYLRPGGEFGPPAKKQITTGEEAYHYTMDKNALDTAVGQKQAEITVADKAFMSLSAGYGAGKTGYEQAYALIGYDTPGTGKITETAKNTWDEVAGSSQARTGELLKPAYSSDTVLTSGADWGFFGGVISIGAGLFGPTTSLDVVSGIGSGAMAGMVYEGGKRAASAIMDWGLTGSAREAHIVPNYMDFGSSSPSLSLRPAKMGFESSKQLAGVAVEFPKNIELAKNAPTGPEYIEAQMRGQTDLKGSPIGDWNVYLPERGINLGRETVGIVAGVVTAEIVPTIASAGSKWLLSSEKGVINTGIPKLWQETTGRYTASEQVLTGTPLYSSHPTKQIANEELVYAKDARLSGVMDIKVTQTMGSKPGSNIYNLERVLESPFGGPKANPFQSYEGIKSVFVDDAGTRALYTSHTPKIGESQIGIEAARTRYQMVPQSTSQMPYAPQDEIVSTRYSLTRFELGGTGVENQFTSNTRTLAYDPRSGVSETILSGNVERSGKGFDFSTFDFSGSVEPTGSIKYPLSGRLFVTNTLPQASNVKMFPPSGGPKTPWPKDIPIDSINPSAPGGSKIINEIGVGGKPIQSVVSEPSSASIGRIAAGAGETARTAAFEELTFLSTPPGFAMPIMETGGSTRTDTLMLQLQAPSISRTMPPSEIQIYKNPTGQYDELLLYRTVPKVAPPVTDMDYKTATGDTAYLTRTIGAQGKLVDGLYDEKLAYDQLRLTELAGTRATFQETSYREATDIRNPTGRIPDFIPGIPDIGVPGGGIGIPLGFIPKDLPTSEMGGLFGREQRRGRKGGARLKPMANLFDVFKYESRTGKEFVHERTPRSEAAFSEALAGGYDFSMPSFGSGGRAKTTTKGIRGKKSPSLGGFSLGFGKSRSTKKSKGFSLW